MLEICDIHSHFLPGMDDGSKSAEEAVRMLKTAYDQGIRYMVATPHYYPEETVASFLQRREQSAKELAERMIQEKDPLPQIVLGAEVSYYSGISRETCLNQLCLGNSRYLLLELPFFQWDRSVLRELYTLGSVQGITPILAHIERYLDLQSEGLIRALLDMDVLLQMNASYASRGKGKKMLKNGMVDLLGSDCHNMTHRPPNLGLAISHLQGKKMKDTLARISAFSREIFTQATKEER